MTTGTERKAPGSVRVLRDWLDATEAVSSGYWVQWRRLVQLSADLWGLGWVDQEGVREAAVRMAQAMDGVIRAQTALTVAWWRTPLWLTDAASLVTVQHRSFDLAEAQRELVLAIADAVLVWQQPLTDVSERAAETAHIADTAGRLMQNVHAAAARTVGKLRANLAKRS